MNDSQADRREIGPIWRRWNRAQKLSLALLVGGLSLLGVVVAAIRGGASYQVLEEGSREDLQSICAGLAASSIDWRTRTIDGPAGRIAIEVPAAQYQRASQIAITSRRGSATSSFPALEPAGIFAPRISTKEIDERQKKIKLEETILFNPNIARIRFMLNEPAAGPLDRRRAPPTASVGLELAAGVQKLSAGEVQAIRQLVRGAFDIALENIEVVDQRNTYPYASGALELFEYESAIENEVQSVVAKLYTGPYEPWEFKVGIIVKADRIDAAPARGLSESAGRAVEPVGPAVSESAVQRRLAEATRSAAGGAGHHVSAIAVQVLLDIGAVLRVLRTGELLLGKTDAARRGASEYRAEIDAYVAQQKELLLKQIPYPGAVVEVSAQVLHTAARAPEVREPAAAPAARAPRPSIYWAVGGGIAGAGLAAAFLGRVLRRGRAAKPVHPIVRSERSRGVAAGSAPACHETLELAREASRLAGSRPDVALAVVRFWLASSSADSARQRVSPGLEPGVGSEESRAVAVG